MQIYLVFVKHFHCWRQNITLRNLNRSDQLEKKKDDLNAADDGESRQQSHGSSNKTQLSLSLDLLVLLDVVKGRSVKVDLNQLQSGLYFFAYN